MPRPLFDRSNWTYVDRTPKVIRTRVAATCKRIVDSPVQLHYASVELFKAGRLQIVISENFRTLEGLKKFYRAKASIENWDITRIRPAFARIWLEMPSGVVLPRGEMAPEGMVLPVMIRWEEMGKIANDLGVELADLAKRVAGVRDNRLFLSGRMKGENDLANDQIRQMITDYMGRKTGRRPPTLYADIFLDQAGRPSVRLGQDTEGRQVIMPLTHLRSALSFSIAGITFLSTKKVEVELLVRTLNMMVDKNRFVQEIDSAVPEEPAAPPPPAEIPRPYVDLRGKSGAAISKTVAEWYHNDKVSAPLLYDRNNSGGQIVLCSVGGIPFFLPGWGNIPSRQKRFLLLLQKEEIGGQKAKTATLLPHDADPFQEAVKKLAVWQVKLEEPFRGIMIYPAGHARGPKSE